jgi:hypothetical protein
LKSKTGVPEAPSQIGSNNAPGQRKTKSQSDKALAYQRSVPNSNISEVPARDPLEMVLPSPIYRYKSPEVLLIHRRFQQKTVRF